MAYDPTGGNTPKLDLAVAGGGGSNNFQEWHYKSADTIATVRANGYFSDGVARGVKLYDVVTVVDTATPAVQLMVVEALNADGSIDLTDGTAISQTDTD